MEDHRTLLCRLLDGVEEELRRLALWSDERPPPQALRSTLPFCVDTLAFTQWLQWILLPQLRQLLALDAPLPGACAIAPMAEHTFRDLPLDTARLQRLLLAIDRVITTHRAQVH